MGIDLQKIELAKKILDTNNQELINHIDAVFKTQSDEWLNSLPEEVKYSVLQGLSESEANITIAHEEAMKPYKKWRKK